MWTNHPCNNANYTIQIPMKEISIDLKINSVSYGSKIQNELHDIKTIDDEVYSIIFKILFYDIKHHLDPIVNSIINNNKIQDFLNQ